MEVTMREQWTDILVDSMWQVIDSLARATPRVLAVLTFVALGWALGTLASRLTLRALRATDLDGRCVRWGLTASTRTGALGRAPSELVSRLVFWLVLLLGLLMGIEALGMPGTAGVLAAAVGFLPGLLIALAVVVAGWVLAQFLAQTALIATVNAGLAGAPLVAAAVRWVVLVIAGAIALTQLGIAREMVLLVFGIAFGGTVLALALAFGLGARDLARQLLETQLRRQGPSGSDPLSHV
jgi:hypothetical protein